MKRIRSTPASIACCAIAIVLASPVLAADPGLLELDRMQLQREQRSDELRLRLEQDQRASQLQLQEADRARRALPLQQPWPQMSLRPPSEDAQRRLQLEQRQFDERLSQQLLLQHQSTQELHLRQSLMFEPDATARARLDIERQRFMRERDAQLRQFGTYTR